MAKINLAAMIIVMIIAACVFSETKAGELVSVPRIYLKYKSDGMSYNAQTGFTIIRNPYFSFDPNYVDEKVKYFGRNIAKEMESIPKAKEIMNGYMIHGIGFISCVVTSVGIFAGTAVYAIKHSEKKPDGTYDTRVPAGIPVAFGVLGIGLVFRITKPIYLDAAVNEYNRYARN